MRSLLVILLLYSICGGLHAGGGWPSAEGEAFIKIGHWWLNADQYYDDQGMIAQVGTISIQMTSIYAEYGITDRLTAVLYAPLLARISAQPVAASIETLSSVGDVDLILKYGLSSPQSTFAVAASLGLGLPTGSSSSFAGRTIVRTGDGEFNQLLQIDVGSGWQVGHISMYANAYAGYNRRTNDYADELRIGAELGGLFFNQKLWMITRLQVVSSLDNGDPGLESSFFPHIFANNTGYRAIGAEMVYQITSQIGVTVGTTGAFSGRNILARPSYSFGLFAKI